MEASRPEAAISEVKITDKTPTNPNITPPAFLKVIGSFRIRKEIINTKMGVIVITIEALVADVSFKPVIKVTWLIPTPNNDPMKRVPMSFLVTFSVLRNSESSQKAIAPNVKRE